ncbi:ATP-binding protein [Roseospira visakhapatnamensis]|uniref:histidine kinase n=1 Tax=Roseospira visakhapatnamensis TaxID=390880 RepID=A0A7W6W9S6_9PROT|nr:ATP-binding protein [Roseospira visakhapatnamensis]MBB4265742.1 two-component system phosphate regulon sensor histidine kinase PhoR [Roseospira visakhapatnamensis]
MVRHASPRLKPRRGRVPAVALAITAPALATMGVLVLTGAVSPGPAALAVLAMLAGAVLVVRPHLLDLAMVEQATRDMAGNRGRPLGTPEIIYSSMARAQMTAVQDMRRALEHRLADQTARAESNALVVDALTDPILLIDSHGTVTRVNAGARALFGRDGAGRPLSALLREPSVLEAVESVLTGGAGRMVQITLPGAIERECEARVTPLSQRDTDGAEVLLTIHDVTKLVRMERMRADFVANASHELRTPLSSLLGFVETLMGPARDDAEARERFLPVMLEQGQRMQRLVEDLLSLSRIEMNEHSAPTDVVPIPDLVRRIANGLELKAEAKGCTLAVDLDPALPPVWGDADQLSQVFQNLLDNAVKYGRAGTPVTVTGGVVAQGPASMPGSRRGPCLHVAVRDHGEGIAREHLPRLTERFYRVDRARSRQMGGTGLGLAIAKHVLTRHRGALVPESMVGEGSTFNVYLPLASDTLAIAPPPEAGSATQTPRETVMADADPDGTARRPDRTGPAPHSIRPP